jgi:signal transduction histidine kinase
MLEDGLRIIKAEALRMDELIDSLLLLARSDSGKQSYAFEQTGISELLKESVAETMIIAPEFEFETEIGGDISVKCDAGAIRRAIRVLLSNAVKYSEDEKRVKVKLAESHGLVSISVTDRGIGIPPEHLPRIFDRFYRVDDSRSKKTGSSGLGLAIAKEIITAHGGEIQASSGTGSGTEFNIILPK